MTPFLRQAITEMLPHADPDAGCVECGYLWNISASEALAAITAGPERYAELLGSADAAVPAAPDDAGWRPGAYVWHVGDVTRAWAERLHCLRVAPEAPWAGFDPDELAAARHYDELPVAAAPWALDVAVSALLSAHDQLDPATSFEHPEWGHGTLTDALRWVAHEIVHHQLDVRRAMGAGS